MYIIVLECTNCKQKVLLLDTFSSIWHSGILLMRAESCESLQQRIAWRLPQFARQLPAVLQDDLGGDHPEVDGQQLVALHHLALAVLTVVPQQLPVGGHSLLFSASYFSVLSCSNCCCTCNSPRQTCRWGECHRVGRVFPPLLTWSPYWYHSKITFYL